MDFSCLTRSDIARLTVLITERDLVKARLAEISKALGGGTSVGSGFVSASADSGAKKEKKAGSGKGRSGYVKDAIIQVLMQAPVGGVSVETIAESLNRKPAAIHVWFSTTGKTIQEIQKVGPGVYAWSA